MKIIEKRLLGVWQKIDVYNYKLERVLNNKNFSPKAQCAANVDDRKNIYIKADVGT